MALIGDCLLALYKPRTCVVVPLEFNAGEHHCEALQDLQRIERQRCKKRKHTLKQ
jgi:hypothetical protein